MLFFLGIWLALAIGVWRARAEAMSERARMPLDDGDAAGAVPRD
jgi:hypothetical protein